MNRKNTVALAKINNLIGRLQGLQEWDSVTEIQKNAIKKCEEILIDAVYALELEQVNDLKIDSKGVL